MDTPIISSRWRKIPLQKICRFSQFFRRVTPLDWELKSSHLPFSKLFRHILPGKQTVNLMDITQLCHPEKSFYAKIYACISPFKCVEFSVNIVENSNFSTHSTGLSTGCIPPNHAIIYASFVYIMFLCADSKAPTFCHIYYFHKGKKQPPILGLDKVFFVKIPLLKNKNKFFQNRD